MFNEEERQVLRTLNEYMTTVHGLDARYDTVTAPSTLVQKLINFHDAHAPESILEPEELRTDPKIQSVPPPPALERAMRTLQKVWMPQAVSCAHCAVHMMLHDVDDLAHFIDIHEKCGG